MGQAKPKTTLRQAPDTYMELVNRFPLRPIRNDGDHKRAEALVGELMARDDAGTLDTGASDYLDTLILLVNKYEDEHHSVADEMTPQQALRALMEANQMKQTDIGRIIGSESAVSMFLNGTRALSKTHLLKLAARFKVDPTIFMDAVIGP